VEERERGRGRRGNPSHAKSQTKRVLRLEAKPDALFVLLQGILNNWEIEKQVWDRVFSGKGRSLKVSREVLPSSFCTDPDPVPSPVLSARSKEYIYSDYRTCHEPTECTRALRSNDFRRIRLSTLLAMPRCASVSHSTY